MNIMNIQHPATQAPIFRAALAVHPTNEITKHGYISINQIYGNNK